MDSLLKVPEAAKALNVTEKSIWCWIYQRRIGIVRLGRSVRIKQLEIDRFISEGEIPARSNSRAGTTL